MSRVFTSVFLLLLSFAAAATPARDALTVRDAAGIVYQPFALSADRKAVVLLFIANECPISNSYAPEINRITAAYARRGLEFYLVNVDTAVSPQAVRQHARQYGFICPVLLDTSHTLVKRTGVTVTPEVAIYTDQGLCYRGRIDDKYADFGKVRYAATRHDLQNALDAILTGLPVSQRLTKAVGCPI